MGRKMKVFGSAPYLGLEQQVRLGVRFGDRTVVMVSASFDNPTVITVDADITGREGRYNLVTECLDVVQHAYEDVQREPPTKFLVMTWEKALNDAWRRVLA